MSDGLTDNFRRMEAEVRKLKRQKTALLHQINIIHNSSLIMSETLGNILNEDHWRKERDRKKGK